MKKMMIAITVATISFSSCTQIAGWSGKGSDSTSVNTDSLNSQLVRDESINEANAYSGLFLDSNAIAHYIREEKLPDSTAAQLWNFYKVRNFGYAWFATDGITEQARSLWSLYSDKNDSSAKTEKSLRQKMDTLLQNDSLVITGTDSSYAQTEIALTRKLLEYASENPNGSINKQTVYYLVPAKKVDAMQLADSILKEQKDSARYSNNKIYNSLRQQLATYYGIAKNGGWPQLPADVRNLKKGVQSPAVVLLKKRLQATKEYPANDTTNIYSDSLEAAVKNYQQRNGFQPNGIINDSLVAAMNIPAEQRVQQILLNMNRSLWMQGTSDSNRIEVNIPSFMLYAYEGTNKAFEMPVIVGKEGSGTVMFSGNISQIVFAPEWNLPSSIVKNEILPAMKKDASYLKTHHMEVVGRNDSLPEIRQLPGKDNALGRVKFLFPNSFDIYLHDTPDKTAFAKTDRALSHGCIRVADAAKLAQYLLRDQPEWNQQKIAAAMNGAKEEKVSVKKPEAVLITYYTAWVDDSGALNFRNDIYGHDNDAMQKMFLSHT
jgi:murein L,D-transpeptidase YcbB/YkuD